MATYIQNVTDYIPEYQPFQPDLNFYGNLMQAKQSIYDQNYKSLNNVYNQLYSAELTNKENVKNRDELLKQLDFNLNRIAGLDLSLEQNVEQAQQVFKPFYENKSLMRDMAYTKNWNNTYSSAQALKTSQDEKQRKQYWDEGIRKMQYEREAFANASLDDILKISDSEYTPNVDVIDAYQKLAADSKLSVDITQSNGRYFVRQKNGPLLQAPLTELFAAKLNGDPAMQAYYKTKAFVTRMDTAHANKDKFGSVEAAEKDYLITNYGVLKEQANLQNKETQKIKQNVETKLDIVKADVKNGEVNEHTEDYVQSLEEALGIVTVNAEATQNLADQLSDKPSYEQNKPSSDLEGLDLSNLELARLKVDMGIANGLANGDINRAAGIFSKRDMIQDMSADPYGVSAQNHAFAMQRQANQQAFTSQQNELKHLRQKELVDYKANIDNKVYISDGKGGYIPNPAMFNKVTKKTETSGGAVSFDPLGLFGLNKEVDKDMAKYFAQEPMDMIFDYIEGVQKSEKLDDFQVMEKFFGISKNDLAAGVGAGAQMISKSTGITFDLTRGIEGFRDALQANPEKFLSAKGSDFMQRLYDNATGYADQNKGAVYHKNFLDRFAPVSSQYVEYTTYLNQKNKVTLSNNAALKNGLMSSPLLNNLPKNVKTAAIRNILTLDNALISKEDFINLMEEQYGSRSIEGKRQITIGSSVLGGVGTSIGGATTAEETGDVGYAGLYEELKQIYKQTVSDGNQISSYNSLLTDKAQSILANKENGNTVFLGAAGTPGFGGFMEFMQKDYANINWEDDQNNNISFFGYTKSGLDSMKDLGYDTDKVRSLTDRILSDLWSKVGDPKAPTFDLTSMQYSLESNKKGAMILYPTADILKPYLTDKVITQEAYDAMLLHGISFISDRSNFTNSIFTANIMTPIQAAVNSLKPGQTMKHFTPAKNGYVEIQKNSYGTSDYTIDLGVIDFYDSEGNKHSNVVERIPPVSIGNNFGLMMQGWMKTLQNISEQSTVNYKSFHQSKIKQ